MSAAIGIDATYSTGKNPSGIAVYSRELIGCLARAYPDCVFDLYYRPHRLWSGLRYPRPANCRARLLLECFPGRDPLLFHGLNQRLPVRRLKRAVATFHDLFVLTGDYSTPEFKRRFAGQAAEAASRADLIIAVSRFTAGQVENLLGVDAGRIRVVPHGFHSPASVPSDAERQDMILHVGAVQARKNVARAVEAFERCCPGWRLVLAGSFGYGSQGVLESIRNSPARDRIEVLGWVDNSRLAALYAKARILLFPSLDEGFGIPVLEAMGWGVPVITSNRAALPEVAGEACLLVDPGDVDQIGEALSRLASQPATREEMARQGRQRARGFSWEVTAQRTWDVYRELVD